MTIKQNMKKDAVWLVRDARGLTVYEKAFLFVVASRGAAKTYRKTLMADMGGISTGQLSKVVASLREKDLIEVHEGYWKDGKKTQTVYTIKEDVLATFVPARDGSQDELGGSSHELVSSHHELVSSPHELGSSHHGGYKETVKETEKVTKKETVKTDAPVVADAPPVTSNVPSNSKVRNEGSSNLPLKEKDSNVPLNSLKDPKARVFEETKARLNLKKQEAANHLEAMVLSEGLTDEQADRARAYFADKTFRAASEGFSRATSAVWAVQQEDRPVVAARPTNPLMEEAW